MPTAQFLLLLALSPLADSGEDEAQTLQAIRTAVREQVTSIKSLGLVIFFAGVWRATNRRAGRRP
jgi:biotin operon repressor